MEFCMSKMIVAALVATAGLVASAAISNAQITAATVREKADQITQDLRAKVDAADKRLKEVMVTTHPSAAL
jgi:hypothetical protein